MQKKTNIVELKGFRDTKKTEEAYRSYLGTLSNGQLETEINYLMSELSKDDFEKDFFARSKLILKEISSRTQGEMKKKIDKLNEDTFRLI
jgi:hypothetical protein